MIGVVLPISDMYARASERARGRECDATLPGSGEPTLRNIGRATGCTHADVVASTTDHENSHEKASSSSRNVMVDLGPP